MDVCIVGWGYIKFGCFDELILEDMIVDVIKEVVVYVGVDYVDIDGIWLGNFNVGLVFDGFVFLLVFYVDEVLCFILVMWVENVCVLGVVVFYFVCVVIQVG